MTDPLPGRSRADRDSLFAARNKEAISIIEAEVAARREKTAKLKALRLGNAVADPQPDGTRPEELKA